VDLVDEEDDLARAVGDLLDHRLEPVLELAAVLGSRDEGAHVQSHESAALQVNVRAEGRNH
jgi:hypothetical protein